MIDFAAVPPLVQALLVVGVILVEAVVLYVGYGAIERVVEPPLTEILKHD